MENERVLGYRVAREITHAEMNEVVGGKKRRDTTFGTSTYFSNPLNDDVTIDQDAALDA